MWGLIQKIAGIIREYGVSLEELIEIANKLMNLPSPPDWTEEAAFRKWVCTVLHTAIECAELTPTSVDNVVLEALDYGVESDVVWPMFYKLLNITFRQREGFAGPSSVPLGATTDEFTAAQQVVKAMTLPEAPSTDDAKQAYGCCDPGTVVAVAIALFELYKYIKSRD